MLKLSFIVPVYNVEKYLRKCVESLIKQDYDSYEIILVDDGSTDGSGELCDEIVRANDGMSRADALNEPHTLNDDTGVQCKVYGVKIRVIHQANAGLSAARNAGLKETKGEYVCFVDSDDYWEENVLGGLMEQVDRERLDVLRFDYRNVNEHYDVVDPNKYPHPVDTCADIVTGEKYLNERMFYTCYAVMYIIRREIVPTFTLGIHFEDVDWFPRMMLRANRVNSTTTIVYNYLLRQGSITQVQGDKTKILKNLEDNYFVLNTLNSLEQKYPNCIWLHRMASMIASGMLVTIATYFYEDRKEYIKRLQLLRIFPLQIENQGKTYRRRAAIINLIGPKLYCNLMKLRI